MRTRKIPASAPRESATARSMKAEGLPPEQIKRFTGLSEDEY